MTPDLAREFEVIEWSINLLDWKRWLEFVAFNFCWNYGNENCSLILWGDKVPCLKMSLCSFLLRISLHPRSVWVDSADFYVLMLMWMAWKTRIWTGLILCFSHPVQCSRKRSLICGRILRCNVCCRKCKWCNTGTVEQLWDRWGGGGGGNR